MITYAGQLLNATAAEQPHTMLVQLVANSRYISENFKLICQANSGYFAQRRIRLLGSGGLDDRSNSALLR